MNSLSQLISDLDLDESMVMRKIQEKWNLDPELKHSEQVPYKWCQDAVELVMEVLKSP